MRKVILFVLCLLSVTTIHASNFKNNLKYDISLYLGFNARNPAPIFGGKIGFEYSFLRAAIDVGKTDINHPKCYNSFVTFSPTIGFCFGKKVKFYLMSGFQTYGFINLNKDPNYFRSDHIYGIAKIGVNHYFSRDFFLVYEANYLFHDNKNGVQHFSNANLCIGIGYAF